MIFFEIKDKETDTTIASNLEKFVSTVFVGRENQNIKIGKYKNAVRENALYSLRLIIVNDEALLNSSSMLTRTAETYLNFAPVIKGIKRDNEAGYKVFFHNLITTHAQLQGEVESILPEHSLIGCDTHNQQLNVAKKAIQTQVDVAADAILQISKRTVDFQSQIEGFKILTGDVKPDFGKHNIKRALLSVLYPFFDQLNEANVYVDIRISDEIANKNLIHMDYKLFNVAMHHFFNNIAKYCKPHTNVNVFYRQENNTLLFEMHSVRIDREELQQVFKLHVSGIHAKAFGGDGIGMYMVGTALELMGSRMEISPEYSTQEVLEDIPYVKNKFLVYLPNIKS